MIGFIRKKIAKFLLVGQLERDAYQQEMNAAYDEQVIDDLKEKIAEHRQEIEKLEPQIEELKNAHEYEKREKRKKLEGNKAEREKVIKSIEDMIARVIQAASNERQKAAQSRHRAAFIRKKF
jgi:uncharacterized coiled-coil protein SlyX